MRGNRIKTYDALKKRFLSSSVAVALYCPDVDSCLSRTNDQKVLCCLWDGKAPFLQEANVMASDECDDLETL